MSGTDPIREAAVKRLKAQDDFKRVLGIFVIVWLILTAIWALSGGGYFWPVWAIFGMAIALLFIGFGAYGPRSGPPSEERVAEEMKRFGKFDE